MPPESDLIRSRHRLVPLSHQALAPFSISAFRVRFLATAERPALSFVAPGGRVFSSSLLSDIYGAEAPDSRHRKHYGDSGEEDRPTLIPPGIGPVSHDVGHDTDLDISSFGRDWGFGEFAVNRQSGLYLMPDADNSDAVYFVDVSGRCNACEFGSPYRWGPARQPKLVEAFNYWAALV
ncbi:hypothetical protein F5B21DRAFT_479103 [Xylaria acuta]|nr:hypothetical protein F5B21DRAFT_479103 [Xylaria acuta]